MCKPCKKTYNAVYYSATKGVHNPARAERRRKARIEANEFIIEYLLTHPCVDCGESDIVVLDFDHQRDKTADINQMRRRGCTIQQITAEIAKCEVVCANDHRRRTARAQGWGRATHVPLAQQAELLTLNQ